MKQYFKIKQDLLGAWPAYVGIIVGLIVGQMIGHPAITPRWWFGRLVVLAWLLITIVLFSAFFRWRRQVRLQRSMTGWDPIQEMEARHKEDEFDLGKPPKVEPPNKP